jgi:hypothetical protein
VVRGTENIPDGLAEPRAVLFVGNHTRFGLYDLPFLMMELHLRGHNVRPPAHTGHILLTAAVRAGAEHAPSTLLQAYSACTYSTLQAERMHLQHSAGSAHAPAALCKLSACMCLWR